MSDSVLAGVWARITDLTIERGEGTWIETVDGERYLDATAGIAVCATGHCHPKVVEAIREQAGRVIHAQVNCYHHDLLEPLGRRLRDLTPPSIEKFFFSNSGAEAVEAAIKLAKQFTGRTNVIVFTGSFHGRTHLTGAMTTSKATYRLRTQPVPAGIFAAPFPDFVRYPDEDAEIDRCLEQLEFILEAQSAPSDTAAMIIEPVQGEGGYRPVPPRFMAGIAELCRQHGILLIIDEVQTGFGRTGTTFAVEQYDVEPDIFLMAKGIASGMPISAVGARAEIMDSWVPGSHGGTYGGNPVACAAALATIDVVTDPAVMEGVTARAAQLRTALNDLAEKYDGIVDVRGLGLMLALEFADSTAAATVMKECFSRKLIVTTAGRNGAAIRWMPPLVITEDELAQALAIFVESVDAVLG